MFNDRSVTYIKHIFKFTNCFGIMGWTCVYCVVGRSVQYLAKIFHHLLGNRGRLNTMWSQV